MEFLGFYQVLLYNYSEVCSVGSSLFVPVLSAQRGVLCCFTAEACGSLLLGHPETGEMLVITNRGVGDAYMSGF